MTGRPLPLGRENPPVGAGWMPMREVSSIIIDLSGMKIVSKGKHQESDTNFLEKLHKEVKEDYNNNRDILVEFFTYYVRPVTVNFNHYY